MHKPDFITPLTALILKARANQLWSLAYFLEMALADAEEIKALPDDRQPPVEERKRHVGHM